MPQSTGNLARNTGIHRRYSSAASAWACRSAARSRDCRRWSTAHMFSSLASLSPTSRRNRSPFLRGRLAMWASTNTRSSTNSAVGSGIAPGPAAVSGAIAPHSRLKRPVGSVFTRRLNNLQYANVVNAKESRVHHLRSAGANHAPLPFARQRAPTSARRRAVDRLSIVRRTPCTFSIPLRRLPQGEAHIRIGAACQGFQAPIPSDPSVVRTSVRHVNSRLAWCSQ